MYNDLLRRLTSPDTQSLQFSAPWQHQQQETRYSLSQRKNKLIPTPPAGKPIVLLPDHSLQQLNPLKTLNFQPQLCPSLVTMEPHEPVEVRPHFLCTLCIRLTPFYMLLSILFVLLPFLHTSVWLFLGQAIIYWEIWDCCGGKMAISCLFAYCAVKTVFFHMLRTAVAGM